MSDINGDITVRVGGIINNTIDEDKFIAICSELFGEGQTVDEYIKLYNDAPLAKQSNTVVHRTVREVVKKELEERLEAQFPSQPTAQDILDAATKNLSDAVGYDVEIEFADEE